MQTTRQTIRMDEHKAVRIAAQVLRTKFSPTEANSLAAAICHNMLVAQETPRDTRYFRMISAEPPYGMEGKFTEALAKIVEEPDWDFAKSLWKLVYDFAPELPGNMVR